MPCRQDFEAAGGSDVPNCLLSTPYGVARCRSSHWKHDMDALSQFNPI